MKKKRISMDKIKKILRMHAELGLGVRKIADGLSVSKTTASDYINGFKACGVSYEETVDMADSELHELLCGRKKESKRYRDLEECFPYFAKELKRRGPQC